MRLLMPLKEHRFGGNINDPALEAWVMKGKWNGYSKMRLMGLMGIAVFFSHFAIDLEGDQLYGVS